MKKLLLIWILMFGYTTFLFAQCQLITGNDRAYEATCFKSLKGEGMAALGLDIAFVDKGSGRVVLRSSNFHSTAPFKTDRTAYLYLEDNKIIKLIDRNIRWRVNYRTNVMYHLTRSEVNKLKKYNIVSVRVQGIDGYLQFANKGDSYLEAQMTMNDQDPINFPRLISDLMN